MLHRSPYGMDDAEAEAVLGDRLKTFFDGVANEPIPDRLLQLVDALDAKMAKSAPSPRRLFGRL